MTTWFTSDEHYGHNNVIDYCQRPFANLEEMHAELIQRHNALVRSGDVVYHIGDFCFKSRLIEQIVSLLNGQHILIPGNHDECHPCNRNHTAKMARYRQAGFDVQSADGLTLLLELDDTVEIVELNHFPFTPMDERYPEWCPEDTGQWLLHGHIHNREGGWKVKDRMINVGVDVWDYEPVSEEQIKEIIRNTQCDLSLIE